MPDCCLALNLWLLVRFDFHVCLPRFQPFPARCEGQRPLVSGAATGNSAKPNSAQRSTSCCQCSSGSEALRQRDFTRSPDMYGDEIYTQIRAYDRMISRKYLLRCMHTCSLICQRKRPAYSSLISFPQFDQRIVSTAKLSNSW